MSEIYDFPKDFIGFVEEDTPIKFPKWIIALELIKGGKMEGIEILKSVEIDDLAPFSDGESLIQFLRLKSFVKALSFWFESEKNLWRKEIH